MKEMWQTGLKGASQAQGISTMVLESPYYGVRRPAGQEGSRLLHVSDLLVLGRATIEESLCLLDWAHRQGYGKLGKRAASWLFQWVCEAI